jgi:protein involved in polysaccharide export with SLBB domain
MKRRAWGFRFLGIVSLLGLAMTWQMPLHAQPQEPYKLGVGDVLQLNVLQQPELDATLTIRPDGTAVIARVGSVELGGLTAQQAEELVHQRLRLFAPNIGDISLTVIEYNALRVYVLGAVAAPGTYTFTTPPTLWDAVRAAGGPTDVANLAAVRLISQRTGMAQTETYDLSALLAGHGSMPDIRLRTGDTIVIPTSEGVPQVPESIGVQVFGSVETPGTISISEPTRLVTVLMRAGSPSIDSQLGEVLWVHREGHAQYRATKVNVDLFLKEGSLAGNPLVYPGDTIRVPQRSAGWLREAFPILLTTLTTTAALIIAVDRINN